jgi:hypothetical protein
MTDTRQTTPEEFEQFKAECQKWIQYFGLLDWRVFYEHKKIDEDSFAIAWLSDLENRNVTMTLNLNYRDGLDICSTAFHEVCELLLHPLEHIGSCRYAQPEELEAARHAIIRTLENTVYKDLK